ncbi:hypothetical protein GH714_008110 [Hevea brasiliensis]|uniref:Large ribosomal subunit protein uL15/eL18 domain-containing protein n=1 Tax=Hevea brasiliensis TaxID=3981 RepID=A0A6A6KIE7_HEVBR|nr:hypothetical protein GH714_008110 [Hevea brasiliensis]
MRFKFLLMESSGDAFDASAFEGIRPGILAGIVNGFKAGKEEQTTDTTPTPQSNFSHLEDIFSKPRYSESSPAVTDIQEAVEYSADDIEIDESILPTVTTLQEVKNINREDTEREQLLGKAGDMKPGLRILEEIIAQYRKDGDALSVAAQARNKVVDRHEKLEPLGKMTTRFKKNRKKRGHVSAGHGRIGKHRKHPEVAVMPEACITTGSSSTSTILGILERSEVKDKASKDNVPMIDVTQYGYFKVLGKGALPDNKPVVVKAKLVSKIAEKKIKENGSARASHAETTEESLNFAIQHAKTKGLCKNGDSVVALHRVGTAEITFVSASSLIKDVKSDWATLVCNLPQEEGPHCRAVFPFLNSPIHVLQFATSGAKLAVGFECGRMDFKFDVSISHGSA